MKNNIINIYSINYYDNQQTKYDWLSLLKKPILISRKDMKYKVILFHVEHLTKAIFHKQ